MPRSIEQVNEWTRDPANRNRHQGDGWHNLCEQFVNNGGGFDQSFGTALAAGNASGWLDPNLATITDGSIGYWGGVWIWNAELNRMEECGHVAFWFRGRWLMASDACTEKVGNGTGTITATDYARLRPAAKWRGHSKRHGAETLTQSSTASLGHNDLEPEMTPEQARMLTAIYDAMFNGGPSMKDHTKSVSQSLAEISATVNKNVLRDTTGDGVNEEISQIQDNADTNSLVRQLISRGPAGTNVPIDYAAIGAAVKNAVFK